MQETLQINVLIVDDEPAAHVRLEDLLSKEDDIRIVEQVRTGREAIRAIKAHAPDLVFLDVQMPGMTGLDVVLQIGPAHMPAVVFVTAYDQYALNAFDLAAIDYLLKPFDDDRFKASLARVRQHLRHRELGLLQNRLTTLIDHITKPVNEPETRYLERIAVDMRGQIRIIPVERIDFIMASGPYVELHVGMEKYLVSEQMQTLEERLDPAHFFRIHRSAIVRLDRIETLLVHAGGDYLACLANNQRLKVSRRRWDDLVDRLGIEFQRKRGDAE